MIIEVFGTLCMLQFYSRKPVNLLQACSFSAHLPKFNPAIPKLQELGEDLQDSQRKIVKLRSDQNTSKIILLYGLRNSFLKCCLVPRSQQYHTFLCIQSTISHVFYATAGMCHVICILHTDPALFTTSLQQLSGHTEALLLEHFLLLMLG